MSVGIIYSHWIVCTGTIITLQDRVFAVLHIRLEVHSVQLLSCTLRCSVGSIGRARNRPRSQIRLRGFVELLADLAALPARYRPR